jgi:hypothetical protein
MVLLQTQEATKVTKTATLVYQAVHPWPLYQGLYGKITRIPPPQDIKPQPPQVRIWYYCTRVGTPTERRLSSFVYVADRRTLDRGAGFD